MTEIMESDMWHVVIIQKSFETCRNPVRSYQIPVFEDIDVVIEFVVVSVSEEKFHLLLALFHLEKHIDRCVTERKGTERALVLGRVLEEELVLLTVGSLYDRMFDRNRLILEVEQGHHLLVDGTLKSDESGVNTLSDFPRKARTKESRDISVIYAFNLEKKEPVCSQCYPGNMLDMAAYSNFIEKSGIKSRIILADKGFPQSQAAKCFKRNLDLHYLNPVRRSSTLARTHDMYSYEGILKGHPEIIYRKWKMDRKERWLNSFRDCVRTTKEKRDYLSRSVSGFSDFEL